MQIEIFGSDYFIDEYHLCIQNKGKDFENQIIPDDFAFDKCSLDKCNLFCNLLAVYPCKTLEKKLFLNDHLIAREKTS